MKRRNPISAMWKKDVLASNRDIYWHIGIKPHWVTIYKTHSKALAFAYTRPYVATFMPVRVIKYAHEYHVQLYDQKNPVVTHTFYPEDVHRHRKLRKRLRELEF